MTRTYVVSRLLLLTGIGLQQMAAQTAPVQPPMFVVSYILQPGGNQIAISQNSVISFPETRIGETISATVVVSNRGAGPGKVTRITSANSSFVITGLGLLPADLGPGAELRFSVVFSPRAIETYRGSIQIGFENENRQFQLEGSGVAPALLFSYILAGGNQTPLAGSESIAFPQTRVGESATAVIIITNRGGGPGKINGISSANQLFTLSSVPLLPANVPAGSELRFSVIFSPETPQPFRGSVRIDYEGGSRNIELLGSGISASLSFGIVGEGAPTVGGPVSMPATRVGATTSARLRVQNSGNGDAQVTAITLAPDSFSLSDLPELPFRLPAGGAFELTITFSPKESGRLVGVLRVNSTAVSVVAVGLGAKLTYAVTQGGALTPITPGAPVNIPNTPVGEKRTVTISATNEGNLEAVVNTIAVSGAAFALAGAVALPVQVAPESSLALQVTFSPTATGELIGTLRVDNDVINLRGIGAAPASAPKLSFLNLEVMPQPREQPAVGLRLEAPYPTELRGRLALSFSSDSFVDDPAIQFATGGRAVDFRVPANSTDAIFGEGQSSVQFQVGTVAGTLRLQASLAAGGVDVTPAPAPAMNIALAASEPRIRDLRVTARTANEVELLVTGYTTARSLQSMEIRFTAAPGSTLNTTQIVADVDGAFANWYQSTASREFGGQFSAALRLVVNGDINAIQSVSVTATNAKGSSAPSSVSFR
jgi:hypothetical protein